MAFEHAAPPSSFLRFLQFDYYLFGILFAFFLLNIPDRFFAIYDSLELMFEVGRGIFKSYCELFRFDGDLQY